MVCEQGLLIGFEVLCIILFVTWKSNGNVLNSTLFPVVVGVVKVMAIEVITFV